MSKTKIYDCEHNTLAQISFGNPRFSLKPFASFSHLLNWIKKKFSTVRPRGTRPRGTQTSLGHDFKKGSKIFAGHYFGTWTSWDTILKSAQPQLDYRACHGFPVTDKVIRSFKSKIYQAITKRFKLSSIYIKTNLTLATTSFGNFKK